VGLKEFILHHNFLGKQFLQSLEARIKNDNYIRHIDLRFNNFKHKRHLADFLPSLLTNTSLLSFDLRFNSGFTLDIHKKLALFLLKNIKTTQRNVMTG
jgi:hypothetical protein